MTSTAAMDWTIVVGLWVALALGASILFVSVRTGWITKEIALLTVIYGFLGGALVLSPKWTEVVFKFDKYEIRIGQLETDLDVAKLEKSALQSQIAKVASLNTGAFQSAGALVNAFSEVKATVDWADFIPTNPDNIKVEVNKDTALLGEVAASFGMTPLDFESVVRAKGLTVLKDVRQNDLYSIPSSDLWFRSRVEGLKK